VHKAEIKQDQVHLLMHDVSEFEAIGDDFVFDTGSPHYIQYISDVNDFDPVAEGRAIRYSDKYKEAGINVNFIQRIDDNEVAIRTYERGVENETLSCGTGCTAAALSLGLKGAESPVTLRAMGGELQVSFEKEGKAFKNIHLIGPARKVFEGTVTI
jgi:diaminopimelate epimerase